MKRLLALSLAFASCAAQPAKPETVNITYVKSPLNAPLIVGSAKGIYEKAFAKEGVKIAWHEINSGAQQTEAMAAGSIDFSPALGGTSAFLAAANGVDLKIMGVFSRAPRAFTIMAKNPAIKSPADLKGKKIGGPKGSVLHQLLAAALIANGLTMDDVTFVSLGFPEALSAIASGNLDAALLPSNVRTSAEKIGARVIVDGEGLIQGSILSAVSGPFAKKHPSLVKAFRDAQAESLAYMNANPEETAALSAEALGVSVDEIKALLPMYNFDPAIGDADIADFNATQDFLVQSGLMQKKADTTALILR